MTDPGVNIPSSPQPVRPIPPRYWWLKRIALAAALLLVAVGILRWRVDVIAARRLNARIAAIQATGEPILPRDFNVEPVPDADNAAILLTEAMGKLVELNPDDPGWQERLSEQVAARFSGKSPPLHAVTIDEILTDPALLDANLDKIERHLKDNEESLRLLHEARLKPAADWGMHFEDSIFDRKFPDVLRNGDLARLACVAALVAHRKGDDRAAIGHLQDVLVCAEHVAQPGLLGGLMGVVMSSAAAGTLEEILPTLKCDRPQLEVEHTATPVRTELENLIQILLADEPLREGIVAGFQLERAFCLDGVRIATEPGGYVPFPTDRRWELKSLGRAVDYLYRPIYKFDGARLLDGMTAQVSACRAQLFGGEAEPGPDMSWLQVRSILDRQTGILTLIMFPQFGGTVEKAARDLSKRHLAATAIAIRLYELDHGRRPETLAELTPDYLPFVPSYPTVPADQPILYVPTGPDPHVGFRASSRGQPVTFSLVGKKATEAKNIDSQPASEQGIDERSSVKRQPGDPAKNEDPDDQP